MSRAACVVVLVLVPVAFAAQQQVQTTVTRDGQVQTTITLPDGTQVQTTGSVQGGVVGGIVGGVQGGIVAQGPPSRDTRPTTGSSRIRGRVLVADTGQPARRASVNVSAPEMRDMRTATTDMDGRYDVANLPAGRFSITASKNGFVGLSYGQTRPTTPSQTLTLAEKQSADGVDLLILRGGAITGRVLDDFGDPVSNVPVMAMRPQFQQGQQRLVPSGQRGMTNDIGEYRLFALLAGSYYIAATPQALPMVLNGNMQSAEERSGFASVFYPGTADPSAASKINVTFGQTVPEINFSLVGTRLSQISGVAVDSQGRPMSAGSVSANPRSRVLGLPSFSGQLKPDGTFIIPNVAPGEYTLRANLRLPPPPAPGAPMLTPPRLEVATAVITVTGDDVSGIRLAPVAPVTVSGRVVFDNPSAAGFLKPSAIRVNTQMLNPNDGPSSGLQSPPPALKDDFTFELQVDPGLVMLRPAVPGGVPGLTTGSQPWALKSLRVNGADVTNAGLELRAGENVSGIEIEMTNRPPEVSGTVTATGNAPAAGFSVIVFPQDRDLWTMPGPGLSAMMRTDQTGHFSTRNLRSGRYYILAVYELEPGASGDPEFLQSAISRATPFSLADGETKTLDLRGQAR